MDAHDDNCKIRELNEGSFGQEVLESPEPVLVAFFAPWSKPCQIVHAVLGEVAAHCAGRFRIYGLNVDESPDLGAWYDIQSIPTLLWFVGGEVRARIVGTVSKEAILTKLSPFIASA